jgi:hypothetical protein
MLVLSELTKYVQAKILNSMFLKGIKIQFFYIVASAVNLGQQFDFF